MEGTPNSQQVAEILDLFSRGGFGAAEPLATSLTQHCPNAAFGWKALGAIYKQAGRNQETLASLQRALALSPQDAEAFNILGDAQKALGQVNEAVASYRRALEIKPDYAEVHNNLGIALRILRQPEAAIGSYRQALQIKPDFAKAHNNLGNVLGDSGQLEAAAASYCCAVKIKPDFAKAWHNLGNVQKELGQIEAALASQERALAIHPEYAQAHNSLAALLHQGGQFEAAQAGYCRALAIQQSYAEAHNNLGVLQKDLGYLDAAVASHRRALAIRPEYTEAHSNLLFTLNYIPGMAAKELLAEARIYGALVARHAQPYKAWNNVPDPDKRLRVGLVSADLRNHPVGYFIEGVLRALADRASNRLEIIAYAGTPTHDVLTERIRAACQGWRSTLGLPDESLARQIHADQIDILIDLSGHTANNRLSLFAWKPAPVQVSWLGYFATTGVEAIDYLIADPWTLPETEEVNFTEKILRLPETRLCFTPPDVAVAVSPLPALENGFVTFGCFSTLTKMNDAVVALWARVLKSVPDSRLLLKARQLGEVSERKKVAGRFTIHGIAADRLMLEPPESREKYLEAYRRVDIVLDTFPFTGGTTSTEGLWMGVPMLTLAGKSFVERQGVGIAMNAGLAEWVALDADDYVARAVAHASDLPQLASLRGRLRQQILVSPLFDAPRFARYFEETLRGMWGDWLKGEGCKN